MKLGWGPDEQAFRAELVAFVDEHAPPEALAYGKARSRTGDDLRPAWAQEWQATLFDHGWMIPAYPPEFGGRNATPIQTLVYLEEMAHLGVPRSLHFTSYGIAAPSLIEFGDERQRALAAPAIRGDEVWCIGMSEPDAGSDLAALQTRAVLDGDRFVVNGQKVWTSYAMVSDWCMCFVRTDPEATKHRGISALMVRLDTPGVDVRPLRQITGSAEFAEVYFTDAVVPIENLLGPLHDGWKISTGSLAHERAGIWIEAVVRAERALEQLLDLARRLGRDGDPTVRRRMAALYEISASLRTLGYKGAAGYGRDGPAPEHSYMKLATSELGQALSAFALELQGAYGVVTDPERGADGGRWPLDVLGGFAGTIAGGTSEIQRNVIAQRVLGLPRVKT